MRRSRAERITQNGHPAPSFTFGISLMSDLPRLWGQVYHQLTATRNWSGSSFMCERPRLPGAPRWVTQSAPVLDFQPLPCPDPTLTNTTEATNVYLAKPWCLQARGFMARYPVLEFKYCLRTAPKSTGWCYNPHTSISVPF